MMELWENIIDVLNEYAGLFSLLAVIAAIVVPICIYKVNRRNELRRLKDRRAAINKYQPYDYPMEVKDRLVESECLDKEIERG